MKITTALERLRLLDQRLYWQEPRLDQVNLTPDVLLQLNAFWPHLKFPPENSTLSLKLAFARLDALDELISGNKWPKMRLWFESHLKKRHFDRLPDSLSSMGGSHSNHLVAFAAACRFLNICSHCYVRANGQGDELLSTPTIECLRSLDAGIIPVSRSRFRLLRQQQHPLFLPEGGKSQEAVQSVASWTEFHAHWLLNFNQIFNGCGTGTWLAGLILGLTKKKWSGECLGIPAVAGEAWLKQDIDNLLQANGYSDIRLNADWALDWSYPGRGFKPVSSKLIETLVRVFQISVDPVYMPRILHAVMKRWCNGELKENVLVIHGGGLQAAGSMSKAPLCLDVAD